MPTSRFIRRSYPSLLILFLGALLYAALIGRHDVGYFEDDAVYVLSARSILSGQYRDLTAPKQPPEIHFLPGFPLLLAPAVAIVSGHWNALKIVPWLLAVLCGFLSWGLYRRWFPEKYVWVALALFVFNAFVIEMSDLLLSEWALLAVSLGVMWLLSNLEKRVMRRDQILLAVLLTWAALIRPEGILLSAALAVALLLRKKSWKPYRWILPIPFLAVAGWALRNYVASGLVSTYTHLWQPPTVSHVIRTLSALPQMILGVQTSGLGNGVLLAIGAALLIGGVWTQWKSTAILECRVVPLYIALFMMVRLIWSVFDARFFLPLIPFLAAYMLQGCLALSRRARPMIGTVLIGMLLITVVVRDVVATADWRAASFNRVPWHSLAFVRNQIPAQATFLANRGGLLTLYTGHLNTGSIEVESPAELAYRLKASGTSYVWVRRQPIVDRHVQRQWVRGDHFLSRWPSAFPVIYNDPAERSTIYKVNLPETWTAAYQIYANARKSWQNGNTTAAAAAFDKAIRLAPDFPDALNDSAALQLERGDVSDAESRLRAALHFSPSFALARLNFARALKRQHRIALAEENLKRAYQDAGDPEDAAIRQWIIEEAQNLHKTP